MASTNPSLCKIFFIFLILISIFTKQVVSVVKECGEEAEDSCNNKEKALPLKLIAIASILVTSIIGVSLPLATRSIPALSPEKSLFVIVKAFASGIILATGFMHVLPDSFDMLSSDCLKQNPWHKFPFTGFVAMLSAIFTLMVDSITTSVYTKKNKTGVLPETAQGGIHGHGHHHGPIDVKEFGIEGAKLLRYRVIAMELGVEVAKLLQYRVIAMVLELGIIVHSIVIGLSLGASNNTCTVKGLIAALCFHQMFEGMGLGGCILQAEYNLLKKAVMAFFFAVTTPFGIALGIALSSTYKENSPRSLITVGLLNASSAGLLIYMALVDLLASDFMGPKLQGSIRLQIKSYMAVLLGAGGMSLMAKWA
ncbi:secondary carrier transporter [Lithospermum erythrorhizon]|uniref:Secondary carrier transporter n=1 Tax=Lithospermum erythrorhizon TaxID=34254 RepID=A0AAV3RYV4_LITER